MSLLDELKRRNVIRVAIAYLAAAWLLIQILETLFPIFALPETSIRVVVVAIAIGFIPALIAAWYFELTPEGLKPDHEVRRSDRPSSSARIMDRVIVAILLAAVGYFAVDKFIFDPARDASARDAALEEGRATAIVESYGDKSVVVLPFANLSSDPEQEFLGDGMAEELLNLLAPVDGLRVISRTSAFSFKGKDITLGEIARELNVSYVLEGSVRKSGNALRITAQLIDARADAHVWSDTYDRSVDDIFVIQDEVAAEVVEQLKLRLSLGAVTPRRHDPAAYVLLMKARQLMISGTRKIADAEVLLTQALDIDPGYHDAKVWQAWIHKLRGDEAERSGNLDVATAEFERAITLNNEVVALDPDNLQAHIFRGWENMRNVTVAAAHFERALELEPTNNDALNGAVVLLTRLWREDEAIPIARYAMDRDPLNASVLWNLARAYLNNGEYELAQQTMRAFQAHNPESVRAPWAIGLALLLQSKPEDALQHISEQVPNKMFRLHGQALALYELQRFEEAEATFGELRNLDDSDDPAGYRFFLIGTAYAWIGSVDDALMFLEMKREIDSGVFRVLANSPLYANLRDDPRWIPFLESVELAPDSLASVEFNPRLPPGIR